MTLQRDLIELRTTDMRATAALMAEGFGLVGNRETARPGILEFVLLVPNERKEEAEKLVEDCGRLLSAKNHEPGPMIALGSYERALQRLRKLISAFKEDTDDDTQGRRKTGRQ